ncbi:MAG: glycosyltransferase family 2 protein [Planctomycetes bacterium]|nr:glycosyltransferase family 2 protein [Planctomycetota bacterium]
MMSGEAQRKHGDSEAGADPARDAQRNGGRPLVSVIAPMYNEAAFLMQFVESMLRQTYPHDRMEVLLIDGGSTDGTLDLARKVVQEHACFRLLHNPDRFLPQGLNIGIRNVRGEIVARADIHVWYPPDYLAACVRVLQENDVWVVGGVLRTEPGGAGRVAGGIAVVQSHLFGVGNSGVRISDTQSWDTDVAFPCMWRWVFGKIGLYQELLPRHEDLLLYSRVRRLGGHLLVDPSIRSTYYARPTARGLVKQAWHNGYETAPAWVADRACVSLRHWVPGAFVALLVILALGAIFWWPAGVALMIVGGLYGLAWFVACLDVGFRRGWRHVPVVAVVFVLHHMTYGLGTLVGIGAAIRDWRKIKGYHIPTLDE